MHFGEPISEERYLAGIRTAYEKGVRTFMTSDVYGKGDADTMLGKALAGIPRDSYCLIGLLGHDIYEGRRAGSRGYARFTHPDLRPPSEYGNYLNMATEKSLERLGTDHFDGVLLHNPDSRGYSQDAVWKGMDALRDSKLTEFIGIAPGPANGFTLDIIQCFERFGSIIDWSMVIQGPFEPWPSNLLQPAAEKENISLIARVIDYGGIFHDDLKPGHKFRDGDHRVHRPEGWVETGSEKMERMRPIADKHGLTMLHLACLWTLAQPAIKGVVPTLIQEAGDDAKTFEAKLDDLAALPEFELPAEDVQAMTDIGNNKGCMNLKGGNPNFDGEEQPDQWQINPDLVGVAERWNIKPEEDLICSM
ncbi:MAG: aryl-alcohol dehydrogenase-like predicted oxidoreductase [Limisphaerales bacterium]|jgi:aryl-alcohol dehydrogenase-like predicted oxidoreductase